ncbi:protoporphyrinogen oxidase [Heyndrickxia sp. NPDC080065]|uniref:protoporphyrinogen oxidase n=1 Tax=Heyndrickxia sp. NPDC080065 TaxID=3390568 RepID=UPI003D029537
MEGEKQKVVIVGGGITGLTAAYYLQEEIKKKNLPIEYKLIEASRRLGGKIQTIHKDGFLIERGPESFQANKKSILKLAEKVGMQNLLVHNASMTSFVVANEKLYSIPNDVSVGIPRQISPFIATGLFSLAGKMRAAADFLLPRSNESRDQSLGKFFRRRFGNEVVENLIEPLLSEIYAGDIDQISLMSTFPQFFEVEKKYRSLLIGMKKTFSHEDENGSNGFLTFKNGLESFVESIEKELEADSVMKGIRVQSIVKHPEKNVYHISLNDGEKLQADSVIVALPHYLLPDLFSNDHLFAPFRNFPTTSVATIVMAFPENAIKHDINGTRFVVSRNSDYTINACTWTHKKWPHSTPYGKVLLRCFVGRAGDETVVDLSDAEIEQVVLDDLKKVMDITEKPLFTIVSRWKHAMPQYTVGHLDRMADFYENVRKELPGMFITGSSFNGISIPDCIEQGESVVNQILQYLKTSSN